MNRAVALRSLFVLLLAGLVGVASAKSDAGAEPVPYQREARFSRRYDPKLVPDREAAPLRPALLVYPAKWRQWGQPAYAVVAFLVEATGTTSEIQCIEATDRAFAKAAESAVERTFFMPALKNQQGVCSKIVHRYEFFWGPLPPAGDAEAPPEPARE